MLVISALQRLRQTSDQSEASLSYIVKPCLKNMFGIQLSGIVLN
jgi:hypothetical protein